VRQDLSEVRHVLGDVLSKIHAVHDAQVNLAQAEQVRRRAARCA
jgi:hypothetical protein